MSFTAFSSFLWISSPPIPALSDLPAWTIVGLFSVHLRGGELRDRLGPRQGEGRHVGRAGVAQHPRSLQQGRSTGEPDFAVVVAAAAVGGGSGGRCCEWLVLVALVAVVRCGEGD